jgi:hypothetical protein
MSSILNEFKSISTVDKDNWSKFINIASLKLKLVEWSY